MSTRPSTDDETLTNLGRFEKVTRYTPAGTLSSLGLSALAPDTLHRRVSATQNPCAAGLSSHASR